MKDRFGREITYLRISVTDRCNLRCVYCMPEEGVSLLPREEMLTFEEIYDFALAAAKAGIRKIRVTGGEPLVREDISALVAMLASIPQIADLSMTTNGTLLALFADSLKRAGLMRVNVSLDSVNPDRYSMLTRGGVLYQALDGIAAAMRAGLTPLKINCVIAKSPAEDNARGVARYAAERGIEVRYIRSMNLSAGEFYRVAGGAGGDCAHCNRIRLTANGYVRPCLFCDDAYAVRDLGASEAMLRAVAAKPKSGNECRTAPMSAIGG